MIMRDELTKLYEKYPLNLRAITKYISGTWTDMLQLEQLRDSLCTGQIASKLWLIDCIKNNIENTHLKTFGIFGGWTGILARFMFEYLNPRHIANIEIDNSLRAINYRLMSNDDDSGFECQYSFINCDMYKFDFNERKFDIYVNTSCEHIPVLKDWVSKIPKGKTVFLQSNNFVHEQHINISASITDFERKAVESDNVKEIFYRGSLMLPDFERYMLGIKT